MQEQYSGVVRQHELLLELVMRFQNWPKAANETRLATVMLLMLAYGARARAVHKHQRHHGLRRGGFLLLVFCFVW